MKKFLGIIALAGAATLFSAGEALAVPIVGDVEISGQVDITTATTLTLVNFIGTGNVIVADGDLLPLMGVGGDPLTLTDISLLPGSTGMIWSSPLGFSFTMTSFTNPTLNGQNGKDFTAFGILSGPGFDDTQGVFQFSSNAGNSLASFSASNFSVPEPTTLALFGMGLLGAGFAGRRRKG